MALKNTYRQLAAALLLALYVFIAMPVQYWHHHAEPGSSAIKSNTGNIKKFIVKSDKLQAEKSCNICSHKYSTYDGNFETIICLQDIVHVMRNGFYHFAIIPAQLLQASNKGPPFIC